MGPRRLSTIAVGLLLVVSFAATGFGVGGGVVVGQTTNGTNGTNTSTTTPGGQLDRLAGPNQTNSSNGSGTGQQAAVDFARSLRGTNTSHAQTLVRQNPSLSSQIIERVGGEYPGNTTQQLHETPKQVADLYLGLVGAGRPNRGDNDASGISTGGDDAGGGGLIDFSMRADVIAPTMNTTRTMLANSTVWVLNQSLETTTGTPVPEDDDDSAIVFVPTNDPWAGLYHNFFIPFVAPLTAVLALLGMIAQCGMMPWKALKNPTYSQTRAFVGFIVALVALMFTMPTIWFLHAFVDVLATNIAPSAAELTQSTKGLMNLGAGSVLGIIAAYTIGLSQALLLALVYAFRYGALFVVPWFLPLLIAVIYNAPHKRLSNLASHLTWQYIGLLIQAVPVAFLFRAAFEMEWDFGLGGLMGLLASAAIFLLAAGFPILTSIGMFKSAPSVQTVAAGVAGYAAGSSAADYARQASGQAARAGYAKMPNVKTGVSERVGAVKTAISERVSGQKNTPERGQATIHDYEDRQHPRTGVPKRGKL